MPIRFASLNISIYQSVLKYLSLYGKLFIFTWQLYHQIWFNELCFCYPGTCVVVSFQARKVQMNLPQSVNLSGPSLLAYTNTNIGCRWRLGPKSRSLAYIQYGQMSCDGWHMVVVLLCTLSTGTPQWVKGNIYLIWLTWVEGSSKVLVWQWSVIVHSHFRVYLWYQFANWHISCKASPGWEKAA